VLGVLDRVADLDVVPGMEPVGPAGDRDAVVAELSVLVADGLGAGAELIETTVEPLRDHDRGPPVDAVGVRRVECLAFGVLLTGLKVDAVAAVVATDRFIALAPFRRHLNASGRKPGKVRL
jgi:hypothetical protein